MISQATEPTVESKTAASAHPRVVIMRPTSGWVALNLREVWEYRELLYFMIWRSLKVRYKQTVLGASWAVLQPLLTMAVFSLFLGRLAGVPSDGLPYPLFAYSGLVLWVYFTGALAQAAGSLVEHERMLTKVYFPRLILPLAAVLGGVLDLLLSSPVLIALMLFYGRLPTGNLWMAPFFIGLAAVTAFAIGLWLSALNVQYRDVRYTIPFLLQVWMFSTPIVFPSSLLREPYRALYGINPMAGVVEGFRWALFGGAHASQALLIVSTVTICVLLVGGLYYFRRMERTFADVV